MHLIAQIIRTVLRFAKLAGFCAWLMTGLLLSGCSENETNMTAGQAVAPTAKDSLLFDRLGTAGSEANFGLVTFRQPLADLLQRQGPLLPGRTLRSRLALLAHEKGVGRLVLNGEDIRHGSAASGHENASAWWTLEPGPVYQIIEKKDQAFRLTGEKETSSRLIPIPSAKSWSAPQARLLCLKIRGIRSRNRAPALQVFQNDKRIFDEIILHGKPREYRIPFVQNQAQPALRLAVRMAEVSIPVLADHSGSEAYLQVDSLQVRDAPSLSLHMPGGWPDKKAASAGVDSCQFYWTEFPCRSYAPFETVYLEEADASQTRQYIAATVSAGAKLGRVTRPGIPMRAPARLVFPLRFEPPAQVTFSVGLTPTFRNHLFVQVRAQTGEADAGKVLFEQLVAQPLLEPEEQWHAFAIDLPEDIQGDGRLEFRFSSIPESAEVEPPPSAQATPYGHAYFSNPRLLLHKKVGQAAQPNLILISIDTLRADHLSCYGYPLLTSPNLDRFAQNALIFTQAISSSSWTLPAHLSLLSGMPLGVAGSLFKERHLVTPLPTLAERLQQAGYSTAGFVGGGYVSADFGMQRGFDLFDERSLDVAGGYTRVAKWLEIQNPETPFFLFFHFFDVHGPYGDKAADPERFFRESGSPFDPKLIKLIQKGVYTLEHDCGSFKVDINDLTRRHMIQLYNADIFHVDEWMEKLFAQLRSLNLFDRSAIVITSDHGEEFGEHGNWHHSKNLYREVVHIPLLVKLPGPRPARGKVDAPVSLLDIAPTLASLAGDPLDVGWYGRSLLDIAADPEAFFDRKVLSENVIPHGDRTVRMIALQGADMKYFRVFCDAGAAYPDGIRGFYQGQRQELYGLKTDPLEQVNVADCYPRLLDSMKSEASRTTQELQNAYSGLESIDSGPISPEVIEQLKALGYLK